MRPLLFLLAFLVTVEGITQETTPLFLYGYVFSEDSGEALDGATVVLISKDEQLSAISSASGFYAFENIKPGRYAMEVSYLGYQSQRLVELLIEAGRSRELIVYLVQSDIDLPMAVVRAGLEDVQSLSLPGTQVLSIEETRRLPATFFDPARQVALYPGVVNANDQANNISVRGNSPAGLSWRLEGAEIVNPNHTSNAGTRTDRISDSGGGVNILSAQLLNTSTFYAGLFPTHYGNAQGGLMDMHFRNGNRERWESTVQLGLLGIDFSFEGPFSSKKKASYLFNYRYSTIGLLEALGLPLSDESISFQDLAFHVALPSEKFGKFSIFAMGGASKNILNAERDTNLWEFRRDRSDIDYHSKMGVAGFTHQINLGVSGSWNTSFAYSLSQNDREEYLLDHNFLENEVSDQAIFQSKASLLSKVDVQLRRKLRLSSGIDLLFQDFELDQFIRRDYQAFFIQPFSQISYSAGNNLTLNLGLRYGYFSMDEKHALSPRFSAIFFPDDASSLKLAFTRAAKIQPAFLYLSQDAEGFHQNLELLKSNQLSLAYRFNFKDHSFFQSELYFQYLEDAVTTSDPLSQYSGLNIEEVEIPPYGTLTNYGVGRNYGVEFQWQKYIQEDFYFLINASFFDSQYKNYDQDWRDTRYNAKYVSNVTVGREFRWKKKWEKTLGINIRLNYLGNLRYSPIDLESSKNLGFEFLDLNNLYSEELDPYFKGDFRIYLRTDKKKYSSSLSLDIQNFTNRKNDGFFFYDADTESIQKKNQLGLIPILNWRISI